MKTRTPPKNSRQFEKAAQMLKAVAHPARLEIIRLLKNGQRLNVNQLRLSLALTQSMTSQHLAALKRLGIVACQRKANESYYYLADQDVLKLLDCVNHCCR